MIKRSFGTREAERTSDSTTRFAWTFMELLTNTTAGSFTGLATMVSTKPGMSIRLNTLTQDSQLLTEQDSKSSQTWPVSELCSGTSTLEEVNID